MPKVLAYADRQSVRQGEGISFHVSVEGTPTYLADVVRLRGPNVGPGPHVPAFAPEAIDVPFAGEHPARHQAIDRGSYVRIDPGGSVEGLRDFTLCATINPTLTSERVQSILGIASAGGGRLALALRAGSLGLMTDAGFVDAGVRVDQDRWSFVSVANDDGRLAFRVLRLPGYQHEQWGWREGHAVLAGVPTPDRGPIVVAADLVVEGGREVPRDCFNGRIERPRFFARVLDGSEVESVAALGPTESAVGALGDWNFAIGIDGEEIRDESGGGLHGVVHNLPTRAVGGSNWSGATTDWTARPSEYGAIHFHDDDLLDAGWEPSHHLVVPDSWPSGLYAGRFRAGGAIFWVPFAVRPASPSSDVVFLLPTATYGAYANLRMRVTARVVEPMQGRLTVLDDTDLLLLDQPLGLSTYDTHSDGSTVVHATMRQPVTNFRPEGRIYKFCQDLLIVAWLEHEGVPFDVVTDEDVDREGVAALEPYRVVITGSHPEYVSTKMLDAIDEHARAGGRLMYIGGNGFYSRIAYHPRFGGVVEVRRPDNPKLWAADAAQGHHAFTGERAGLWTGIGRPPHLVAGVGFITQGFDASAHYRRSEASRDERVRFVFDGIDADVIGDFGLLQGGAAGFEIDRADEALGTPSHALVVASSEGHSNVFDLVLMSIADRLPVDSPDDLDHIRADIVFFETTGGGAVFSVGSIAWSGSLAHNGYDNNVALMTRNVLDRFVDSAPFLVPPSVHVLGDEVSGAPVGEGE